ncbi:MAG: ABC transporter substrate-binding protein [Lachnospiraceae bacterium]|nr:ABC transporter substrate-binding protein [Lachnospiraceae bacterium]
MKKVLSLILAATMVLSLAACGGAASSSEAAPASSGEAAPASSSEAAPSSGSEADPASSSEAAPASSSEAAPSETAEKVFYSNQGALEYFELPWKNANNTNDSKMVYETLIGTDYKLDLTTESGMAESYSFDEDGLGAVVTLRDGLKWHDGEDVTIEDVRFSIEHCILDSVMTISVIKNALRDLEGAEEYLAGTAEHVSGITTDGKTIHLRFAKVAPNMAVSLGELAILPKHLLEDADWMQIQQDPYFQKPIGSGPFMFDEVKYGEYSILKPFPGYWDGEADFTIYLNANSYESDPNLVQNTRAGLIDYAYTKNFDDVKALREIEGISIYSTPAMYTRFIEFNQFKRKGEDTINPLSDVRVRQAFAYAIDRKAICDGIFEGVSTPGDGMLTPSYSAWRGSSEGFESYDYDPEKAKALLAEAGWDSSRVLKLAYYYQDQLTVDLMSIVQQYLADVGVKVEPYLVTGDLVEKLNVPSTGFTVEDTSGVEWDLLYGALSAMTPLQYVEMFGATSANNVCPMDDEIVEIYENIFATADVDEQKMWYEKFDQWCATQMPYVPMYYQPQFVIVSDKVDGNVVNWGNPQFNWDWDLQHWTLKY